MIKVDFVILIDHVKRELEYCELLKSVLTKKGYSVKLLSVNFDLWQLLFLKTKVLLIPHSIGENQVPLNFYKLDRGVTILHLDWEQELFPAFYEYKRSRSALELAKIHRSSWSNEYTQKLILDGVSPEMVINFPRPNQHLLGKRLSETQSKDVDIFIPMNLTAAFLPDEEIKARISLGMDRNLYLYYVEMSRAFLSKFVQDLARFCNDYPDKLIVLRPHPLEPADTYREKIKNVNNGIFPSNLSITDAGTVWDWVIRSEMVVTSWSTVALDCDLCGIESYLLRYFAIKDEFEIPSMLNLQRIETMNEIYARQTKSKKTVAQKSSEISTNIDVTELTVLHSSAKYFSAEKNTNTIKISLKRMIAKKLVKYCGFRKERKVDLM